MLDLVITFLEHTGFSAITWKEVLMILVGLLLIYLGIARKYEPLLLVPIGFGAILVNLPFANLMREGGLLSYFYLGIETSVFPPLIFMGIGAMTDFGPLLSKPKTLLLGAAAQFGIFLTLLGAKMEIFGFSFAEACAVANIGGADGPTAIYLTSEIAEHLLGPVAVAAYSYMALVPIIQPPIIRLLTTKKERMVVMSELKPVSQRTKIVFPIITAIVSILMIPESAPLISMLMLGNLFRESGVLERLSKAAANELINVVTIFLAISVGSSMSAAQFLSVQTLTILLLGLVAFGIGTAAGVLLGKVMYVLSGGKVNPMIGAAGVAAVPMSARVVQKLGQEENPKNFLLMNAMGPNVAGVIGSALAAGILLALN
jgi:oxaloacetate decarboxylase beta subunit